MGRGAVLVGLITRRGLKGGTGFFVGMVEGSGFLGMAEEYRFLPLEIKRRGQSVRTADR
jgi:hypothetical protein